MHRRPPSVPRPGYSLLRRGADRIMTALQKKKRLTALLVVLLLATVWFIFSNSMESIPESREKSDGILELLMPLLELFVGKGNVTEFLVRKLAHFAEFFVLGAELAALCLLWDRPMLWALFAGLLTAMTDETIQIFYDRGSQVQDVWLDFFAVLTAGLLAICVKKLRRGAQKDEV